MIDPNYLDPCNFGTPDPRVLLEQMRTPWYTFALYALLGLVPAVACCLLTVWSARRRCRTAQTRSEDVRPLQS